MKHTFYFHFIYKKNQLSYTINESLSAFQPKKTFDVEKKVSQIL